MSQHHDPVHPDSEHLSAEVLADLDLGLLDDASAEHARHHLEHCAQCTLLHDDLDRLTQSLGSLGSSGSSDHASESLDPMPDDVWQRLESALAAEPVVTPEGAATVVPMAPVRKRRFGRPGIGVVAAVAGVALVGAIAIPTIRSMGSNDMNVDTAASGDLSTDEDAEAPAAADMNPYRATRSGTQYDEESLDVQVNQLVAARTALNDSAAGDLQTDGSEVGDEGDGASPSPSVSPTSTSAPGTGQERNLAKAGALATSPAAAQACLEGYLGVAGVTPLAIDIGLWDGEPAAVIVLPKADPTLAEVWVVKPSCSTANAQDPLIYYATITR